MANKFLYIWLRMQPNIQEFICIYIYLIYIYMYIHLYPLFFMLVYVYMPLYIFVHAYIDFFLLAFEFHPTLLKVAAINYCKLLMLMKPLEFQLNWTKQFLI